MLKILSPQDFTITIEHIKKSKYMTYMDAIQYYCEQNNVEPETIKRQLYKYTSIESSFGFNSLAIVDQKPKTCNLKDFLENFLKFREDVVIKRTKFDLKKSEERVHILLGLSVSVENIDKVIKIIRDIVIIEDTYSKSLILRHKLINKKIGYVNLPKFYHDFNNEEGRSCAEDIKNDLIKFIKKWMTERARVTRGTFFFRRIKLIIIKFNGLIYRAI